jgi:hypothetical protein
MHETVNIKILQQNRDEESGRQTPFSIYAFILFTLSKEHIKVVTLRSVYDPVNKLYLKSSKSFKVKINLVRPDGTVHH